MESFSSLHVFTWVVIRVYSVHLLHLGSIALLNQTINPTVQLLGIEKKRLILVYIYIHVQTK